MFHLGHGHIFEASVIKYALKHSIVLTVKSLLLDSIIIQSYKIQIFLRYSFETTTVVMVTFCWW